MGLIDKTRHGAAVANARLDRLSKERPHAFRAGAVLGMLAVLAAVVTGWFALQPPAMSVTAFTEALAERRVSDATVIQSIGAYDITATVDGVLAYVKAPNAAIRTKGTEAGENVLQAMAAAGVDIEMVDGIKNSLMTMFALMMPLLLVVAVGYAAFQAIGGSNSAWMRVVRDVETRFSDVAGADEAKHELAEVLEFMRGSEAFARTGAKVPRGVLMSGPPGTGKTLLAKAMAGEAQASFVSVSGSDFKSKWFGGSAGRVKALFAYARANSPCIVFIDEFDAVGARRSGGSGAIDREMDGTLNQLLVEMDGFANNAGIVVIAATNLKANLDPAVTRPGRLDRMVEVGLPDRAGRRAILSVHSRGRPLGGDVDLDRVAKGTAGFSGAEIENLVNEAAIQAGRRDSATLSANDFDRARDKLIMGLERRSLLLTDGDKRLAAVHEAGHALVACLCEHSDPVHRATIVPHGNALGMVVRLPEGDRVSVTLSRLRDDLAVVMAGRAAEAIVFGEDSVTTGASSDIEAATGLAVNMVANWGMGTRTGMVRVPLDRADRDGRLEAEVREIVHAAYDRAAKLLTDNRPTLDRLADELVARETLEGDEIRAIARAAA